MLTLPTTIAHVEQGAEGPPAYRPFVVQVARMRRLSPHFRRVTFSGADLGLFGTGGLDQRIKILFPLAGGRFGELGPDGDGGDVGSTWHERWGRLPDQDRNPFRTCTVRSVRAAEGELDVDFVDHADGAGAGASGAGAAGPAARWLATARPGDTVMLIGPEAWCPRSAMGIDWRPGDATHALLAGDETAVPAICAILESLPAGFAATAFLEVPTADDALPVAFGDRGRVTWLPRGSAPVGDRLERAVRGWLSAHPEHWRPALAVAPSPLPVDNDSEPLWDGADRSAGRGFYAWLAGESATIRSLRRCMVAEHGIDRRQVAFMGYWRQGQSERQR